MTSNKEQDDTEDMEEGASKHARLTLQPHSDHQALETRRGPCRKTLLCFLFFAAFLFLSVPCAVYVFVKLLRGTPTVKVVEVAKYLRMVDTIDANSKWKATYNPNAFDSDQLRMSDVEIRRDEKYLSTAFHADYDRSYSQSFYPRDHYTLVVDMLRNVHIPEAYSRRFDARDRWPQCRNLIASVYDQGACWHYWLFATQSTIEDRICVASNGETSVKLSKSHTLMCCPECGGCRGGSPEAVYIFWVRQGITTESCQPSTWLLSAVALGCGSPCPLSLTKSADRTLRLQTPPCQSECLSENLRYIDAHNRNGENVDYGIYEPLDSGDRQKLFRYHVKIIGWEMVGNETIFLAANSWGTRWGENGLFRFPATLLTEDGEQPRAFAPHIAANPHEL